MGDKNPFYKEALSWADEIEQYRLDMAAVPVVPFGQERGGLGELRERFQRATAGERREMIAQHGVAAVVRAMSQAPQPSGKGVQDAAAE